MLWFSPFFALQFEPLTVGLTVVSFLAIAFVVWKFLRPSPGPAAKAVDGKGSKTEAASGALSLREGLAKTRREGFIGRISGLFKGRQLNEEILAEIEEVLFTSDIGVKTSERFLQGLKERFKSGELKDLEDIWVYLKKEATTILRGTHSEVYVDPGQRSEPTVILMVGVNGTGKTTTTGKLAAKWKGEGKSVLMGAGDTFRAAAVEQLQAWGDRIDVEVISGKPESDPASVLFDAAKKLSERSADILLADTAGRLHTHAGLLDELKKIVRVMDKALPGSPQEVWLVLDGTTGQNAIQQARIFGEAVHVTGLILTKLDGTAKGGVVLGICDELNLPIRYIGVGEKVDDLRPFDSTEFVDALFSRTEETE